MRPLNRAMGKLLGIPRKVALSRETEEFAIREPPKKKPPATKAEGYILNVPSPARAGCLGS
jgi:hypothetical protein